MLIVLTCIIGGFFAYKNYLNAFITTFLFAIILMPIMTYWTSPLWYQYKGFVPIIMIGELFAFNYNIILNDKWFQKSLQFLFLIILCFLLVIGIESVINDYSVIKGFLYFRNYFWGFLLYIILASLPNKKLYFENILLVFVLLQVILSFFQYYLDPSFGRSFMIAEFIKNGRVQTMTAEDFIMSSEHLVVGSLEKITRLGNFLALYLTYKIGRIIIERKISNIPYLLFFIAIFTVIILTGVRSSLLTSIIGTILCIIIIRNRWDKAFYKTLFISIILIIILPILIEYGTQLAREGIDYNQASLRGLTVFSLLGDNEGSPLYTLRRSEYLLKFLNFKTFFIGTGIYTNNPLGYGSGISSISDIQLLFIIVEFGIIPLLLCLTVYIYPIYQFKRYDDINTLKLFSILFIIIILQTVVDQGLYDALTSYIFFLLCACSAMDKEYNFELDLEDANDDSNSQLL